MPNFINPEPFLQVTKENAKEEMTKFVKAILIAVESRKRNKAAGPLVMLAKFELPTQEEADDFHVMLLSIIELNTKHKHGVTFQSVRFCDTASNAPTKLDIMIAIGITKDEFTPFIKQILTHAEIKDSNARMSEGRLNNATNSNLFT
jgi:hypothetical protein